VLVDANAQRRTVEQLHREVEAARVLAEVVDRDDAWVAKKGGYARLAEESFARGGEDGPGE
jgi:hypothetical protein